MTEIEAGINNAVAMLVKDPDVLAVAKTGKPIAEVVHARLWPLVAASVEMHTDPARPSSPVVRDRRVRSWQYVARFWYQGANGPELVAETDPTIMHGTGQLPEIIRELAAQLHECPPNTLPDALSEEALKEKLPQFRNNLGRANNSALRIQYPFAVLEADPDGGHVETYLCQVDVHRLAE